MLDTPIVIDVSVIVPETLHCLLHFDVRKLLFLHSSYFLSLTTVLLRTQGPVGSLGLSHNMMLAMKIHRKDIICTLVQYAGRI